MKTEVARHIHIYRIVAMAEIDIDSNDEITDEAARKLALEALESGFIGEEDFKDPDNKFIILTF